LLITDATRCDLPQVRRCFCCCCCFPHLSSPGLLFCSCPAVTAARCHSATTPRPRQCQTTTCRRHRWPRLVLPCLAAMAAAAAVQAAASSSVVQRSHSSSCHWHRPQRPSRGGYSRRCRARPMASVAPARHARCRCQSPAWVATAQCRCLAAAPRGLRASSPAAGLWPAATMLVRQAATTLQRRPALPAACRASGSGTRAPTPARCAATRPARRVLPARWQQSSLATAARLLWALPATRRQRQRCRRHAWAVARPATGRCPPARTPANGNATLAPAPARAAPQR
jgi:hypothetical protein